MKYLTSKYFVLFLVLSAGLLFANHSQAGDSFSWERVERYVAEIIAGQSQDGPQDEVLGATKAFPGQGGTGTSTPPTTGQILLGNSGGVYDVVDDLPYSSLTQGSALSVLGVTGNATADVASIQAGTDGQILRRSGTALAFGALDLADGDAVTGILPDGNIASTIARDSELPIGANPTGTIGLSAINGSATTFLRSDGAPALSQAIQPTWSALHTFTGGVTLNAATSTTFAITSLGTAAGAFLAVDPNGDVIATSTPSGGGTPGGSDTQFQYNNGGAFGGASNLVYDDVNNFIGVASSSPTYLFSIGNNSWVETTGSTTVSQLTIDPGYTGTTTLSIGEVGNAACLILRDTDDGGNSYAYFKDGIMYVDTNSCE